MRRLAGALLLLATLPAGAAAQTAARQAGPPGLLPRLALADGRLTVQSLPDLLSRAEVKPHLLTGLTTTLAVSVTATDAAGQKVRGGGRIDVRYELWDEVFLVTVIGADHKVHRETLPSFERLVAWWRGLELPVSTSGRLGRLGRGGPWRTQVRVSLVPFSEAEQEDAQRWLSSSVAQSGAEQTSESAKEAPERLGTVLDLLVATSIRRRPLVSYDWNLSFRPENQR
ncbi:MAG TPA: hypothetical protein VHU81_16750 [Thermoanaerobaculia bacterium]|nr:hypothetical protein [Thermoanaerobaculia bacterium]